jgi:DNA polymerase-3 subunit chi
MTHFDFHFNVPDRLAYACRLLRKVYAKQLSVVVFCRDTTRLAAFDAQLWAFEPLSFIPHCAAQDSIAPDTPIVLTHQPTDQCGDQPFDMQRYRIVLNLDDEAHPFTARFDRCLEVVGRDDTDRSLARTRYKFYQSCGYPLKTYDQSTYATE